MCAVAIGLGVVSCKKEQAVKTPTVKLDETIPSDDETIANELFAMHTSLTQNNKANDKIKDEVDNSPKEINKAIFLIEAYLNYKYDDSTAFELTSIDTSYITIPASLANNNKYQVDYTKFIEAYDKSEIETISHQQREKLRLTNPTVVVIDIELVTPEDPKVTQKDFITRVITVMGYNQNAYSLPYPQTCAFDATEDYWKFNGEYHNSIPNLALQYGKCGGSPVQSGYISCAEKEIECRLNTCNNSCYFRGNYYINISNKFVSGSPFSAYNLMYYYPGSGGSNIYHECFSPTKLTDQKDAITLYANQYLPPSKSKVAYNIQSNGPLNGFNMGNYQYIGCTIIYGNCTMRKIDIIKIDRNK